MAKRSVVDVQISLNETRSVLHNLILTKGWSNVTFTSLGDAAPMSRTGIAHHFKSREGLYHWVKEDILDQLILELESVGINKTNPRLISFFLSGCLEYGCGILQNNFNSIEVGQMVFRVSEKHPANN